MRDKTFKITIQSLWYVFIAMAFSVICVGGYNPYFMKLRSCFFTGIVCYSVAIVLFVRKKIVLDISVILFVLVSWYMLFSTSISLDTSAGSKIAGYYVIGSIVFLTEYDEKLIDLIIKFMNVFVLVIALSILISVPIDDCMNRYFSWLLNPTHDAAVAESIRDAINYSHSYVGFAKEKSVAAYIMGMGICIYFGKYFSGQKLKKIEILCVMLEICALLLTAKRMIPVCLLVIFIVLMFLSKTNEKILKTIVFIFCGSILLLGGMLFIPAISNVFLRFTNGTSDLLTGRSELWKYSMMMFYQSPIIGMGLGSFNEFAAKQGYLNTSGGRWNYYGHNCYLEFLGELGIVGTVILFGALLHMVLKTVTLLRCEKISQKQRFYVFFAFAVEMMLLLYSFSGNVLLYADQTLSLFFAFLIVRSVEIHSGAYGKTNVKKYRNRGYYAEKNRDSYIS